MVERISRETLQEKVYESIKDSIVKNDLMPGDVLSIDSLAEDLGVSPTPVREALAKLSAQGLVENARNKKARVAPISEEDILQTYEVRKLLEPFAASKAAKKIAEDSKLRAELESLRSLAQEIQNEVDDEPLSSSQYENYLEVDLGLEETIELALGDTLLNKMLKQVRNHSLRIRSFTEASTDKNVPEVVRSNNEEHLEIIDSMLDEGLKMVREVVREHLENAESRTLE
ncbi:GntR family transcriptional regulator, partial [Candidatus Bipolaricaulota bacterium]|nr:GntR family transcriptional regulator [Candidatus Bipolaricaulota bacterium]